jgi:hypothetical protein
MISSFLGVYDFFGFVDYRATLETASSADHLTLSGHLDSNASTSSPNSCGLSFALHNIQD